MNKIIAVAIDEYSDPTIVNLNNCSNDINLLIGPLSNRYHFDSIELYAKPEQTTLSFLYARLYDEFINSLESDNILLLFAGHGEFNSIIKTSYWLCSDSVRSNVTTWFNVEDLLKFFSASPAKHIALISDSCFSGAIFELNRGGGSKALDEKVSRQALTSGGIEKVTDGFQNSPFNIALNKVLSENTSDLMSFNELSEKTILAFSQHRQQTPAYGSLVNSGDRGGTYFFKIKKDHSTIVKSVKIPIDINQEVKIESRIEIPFFNENKDFNNEYVNAFVQGLGYSIINDIRVFVAEDEEYSISRSNEYGFYVEVGYSIETLNEKFLSVKVNRSDYLGGLYHNDYVYGINFAFKPERKISLYDILDYSGYSNLECFLAAMIDRYGEVECQDLLKKYSTYEYSSLLDFSFNEKAFTVHYMNLLPHAFKACGFLEIPIENVRLRI